MGNFKNNEFKVHVLYRIALIISVFLFAFSGLFMVAGIRAEAADKRGINSDKRSYISGIPGDVYYGTYGSTDYHTFIGSAADSAVITHVGGRCVSAIYGEPAAEREYWGVTTTGNYGSTYIKYPLAVRYHGKYYDLVIKPERLVNLSSSTSPNTHQGGFVYHFIDGKGWGKADKWGFIDYKTPCLYVCNAELKFTMYVCEPPEEGKVFNNKSELDGYIGKMINWTGWFGFSDLDLEEYVVIHNKNQIVQYENGSTGYNEVKKDVNGKTVVECTFSGVSNSGDNNKEPAFKDRALFGKFNIPSDTGLSITYKGKKGNMQTLLDFLDHFVTIPNDYYRITFDGNGDGDEVTGVPADLTFKNDEKVVIDFTVRPDRSGYAFEGWSAYSGYQPDADKRITEDEMTTGWDIDQYLAGTGGTLEKDTGNGHEVLKLYAQWRPNVIQASAADKSVVYSGSDIVASRVTVTEPSTGYSVQYKKAGEPDSSYSANPPSWKDAGEYTIKYKVTADGYNEKTDSYKLTIEKADLQFSTKDTSAVYTGSSIAAPFGVSVLSLSSGYTKGFRKQGDDTYYPTPPYWKEVGEYTVEFMVSAKNYNTATGSYKFSILNADIQATVTDTSAVYTGSAINAPNGVSVTKPVSGYTIKYRKSGETEYSTARPSWVNVGNYAVEYEISAKNYNTQTGSYKFNILKADIQATATDTSAVYTGGAITVPNGVTVTKPASGYTVKYRKYGETSYSTTRPTWVNAGNYTVEYEITAGNNYNQKTGSFTFTIERASVEFPAGVSLTYNGKAQTGVPAGSGYTITDNTGTDAGNYTAHATPDSNHKWNSGSDVTGKRDIPWSIKRADIEADAADQSEVYTGSAITVPNGVTVTKPATGYTVKYRKYGETAYSTTRPSWTDAGSYTVEYEITAGNNYNQKTGSYTFTIDRAPIEVPAAVSLTYNGKAQTGVPAGSGYTITDNTGTDAGNYTAHATPDSNHKWNSGSDVTGKRDIPWSIKRADIEAAAADQSEVYTGSAITAPNGVTVTKPVTGYTIKYRKYGETAYSATRPSWTNAGSYTVEYEITAGNNYNQKTGSYTFTIERAPIEVPAAVSLTYTGKAQTGVPAGAGYTITDNTGTDAGNYTAHATPDSNHKWNSGNDVTAVRDIPWSIERADIEAIAVDQSEVYSGSAIASPNGVSVTKPATGYTVKYRESGGTEYLSERPSWTDAGNYTVEYEITAGNNYNRNTGSYTFTIDRAPIEVPAPVSEVLIYNGEEQTGVTAGLGYTITDNTGTDAGNYVAHATPDSNHRWNSGSDVTAVRDIPWSIARADIVAAAADQSEEYTGSAITAPNGVTVTKPATGYTVKYREGGGTEYLAERPSWTDAGSYTVEYEITAGNNYNQKTGSYTFTIERAPIEVPAAVSEVLIYNGEEQTGVPAGPGYSITDNTGTDAGNYTAHATPDSNHKWNSGSDVTGTRDIPWSIERAPIEVPAPVSEVLIYNGEEQTGVPAGPGYIITGNTGTDAGNYTAHATPDSNHKWNSGNDVTGKRDIPWSIERAPVEVPAAVSLTYNGKAQTGVPAGAGYSITDNTGTDAGNYTAHATPDSNHKWNSGSDVTGKRDIPWSIDRAPIEVPAAVSEVLIYNGEEQIGVPAGTGYIITDNTGTDAGDYTAHATPDSNHKWNSGSDVTAVRDIPWSIERADIEAAAADQSEVYTGSAITVPNGVTVTKPATGYTVKYRKSGETEYLSERPAWTDAGSYTVEYEITAGNNYNWKTGSYVFTIDRAPIEVPAAVSEVLIYNGEEQTGVPAGSGYTITDNTGTDAGNYVAHATPDSNHKWNSGSDVTAVRDIPWSIGKAPGSITPAVSEDRATYPEASVFSFDHTGDGLISAYSDDEEVAVLTLEGNTVTVTPVNTGECNINIVIAEGGNYSASSASVKMIVEPGKIKVNAPDEVGYYTGSDISPDGITVEIPVSGATVRYSNGTMRKTGPVTYTMAAPPVIRDAGTHTVYYTVSAKNYATESGTFEVIINNANISVEVPHRSVVYNGKPQKPDGIKVIDPETGAEVLYGEAPGSYTLDSPPSFTDAGEHMIYYRATAEDYNERTGSYAYEIMRKPVAVPSAIPGLVYDGTEKTGVREGEGFTLTGNRKTEAGTYKAYASLIKNYIWNDGSTEDKEIEWTIEEEKVPDIPDPGIKVTGVYLNRDYLELTTGVPGIITVRTEPSDAVPEGFTWTVDEPEALSLGTGGLPRTFDRNLSRTVKAQKMGVYTVTVTETGSGLSASCKVRGLAYYDFAKEGYLVTSTAEHEVRKIKGKFYCFDSQGRAEAGFITVNDSAYYFDPDTGVAVKGYQEIKGGRYFFDRKSCVMVRDGMMKFKGKTYHFGTDGKASGGVYYLPDRKDSRAWFYFDENAVMQSGVFRVSLSGNALSGGGSGVPENSVAEDSSGDGLLYFFKKGKLLTPAKDGVFSVNRKKYYVYTDGHVAEGRVTVQSGKGDLIYELDSDGSLLNGTKVNEEGLLYLYKNGVRVKAPKKPAKGGEGVWKTVDKKKYLLKYDDGGLSSNVCFVGNYEDPKAGRLYLKEDGSMAAGELVRVTLGEMQEVMNAGADLPDVEDDDSLWLYYNRKGKLVTREMTKDGWYKVGKQSAYIYEAGNAASGWAVIDGRTYWFDPHTGLTNITVGYVRI